MTLAPLDYVMICVPLFIIAAIAIALRPYMKSVADFLAASRCAGRYLISTSISPMGTTVMGMVLTMEVFSRTGFSIGFWMNFTSVFIFMFTLFGVVTFRFRETRCLTFHQFFEVRYSKSMRVFASVVALVSGLVGFGLVPAVGARFFVYFCGMPESLHWGALAIPTYVLVMVLLMVLSLLLTVTGGQISVMVTDCVEGLISSVFYLVVAAFILCAVTLTQMKGALLSGAPGSSYINPFDISGQEAFNGWYVAMVLVFTIYIYRGGAWNQGFNAAAKTAHEGKMAGILGFWRGFGASAMLTLVSIAAFTLLHHADFSPQRDITMQAVNAVGDPQLRSQMAMPMALGVLLAPGIKGAFCAIALFGLISSQGLALHSVGSTFLQDVILPLRRKPFSPRAHLIALQLAAGGVAVFGCVFSLLYRPADYLTMVVTLIGSIYLGGVGAVVWGGLYWKRGTTAGAWAAMIVGTSLAVLFNTVQPLWTTLQPIMVRLAGGGHLGQYLMAHHDKCPINGQQFSTGAALCALASYVVVSLLTCRKGFDMDRMLHRGKYAIASDDDRVVPLIKGFRWGKLIGIDEHYSRSDKIIATGTFFYMLILKCISISILLWWLFFGAQSDDWWFTFTIVTGIWIPIIVAVITTVWLTIGTVRDLIDLFRTLRTVGRNDADDGTVRNHQNVGEE